MRQHQVGHKPHPLANKPDHLRAHRAHMRNVRFHQKRGHWIRLTRAVANFRARKPETLSQHESNMFEAAKTDLIALEAELDRMGAEADAEIAAEQKAEDERIAGKPSEVVDAGECQVDPFAHQKQREEEHRKAMKAKAKE